MRQIGVRDEARMLGGLAHCGEEMCCARLGGEFQPVSIRMAKEQDLPLNPVKISGACGRLMCCLRYEFEAYKEFKSRAPKKGALIETPLGQAKVTDFDTPREVIHMRLEDGKRLDIPLRDFDCPTAEGGECRRPCRVSREALDACSSPSIQLALTTLERESQALEEPEAAPRLDMRRPRRRGENKDAASPAPREQKASPAKPRNSQRQERTRQGQARRPATSEELKKPTPRPRPGQRSSGIRGAASDRGAASAPAAHSAAAADGGAQGTDLGLRRRRRRRANKPGSSGETGAS
jgi:hypothetical protein